MSTHVEHRPRPPRFPFVAALLCAACLGAAAWTVTKYSYCWDVRTDELYPPETGRRYSGAYLGMYVRLADPVVADTLCQVFEENKRLPGWVADPDRPRARKVRIYHVEPLGTPESGRGPWLIPRPAKQPGEPLTGRLYWREDPGAGPLLYLVPHARRVTGASIAGLVVGAWGVFIFAVAFRHWLERRSAIRDAA